MSFTKTRISKILITLDNSESAMNVNLNKFFVTARVAESAFRQQSTTKIANPKS